MGLYLTFKLFHLKLKEIIIIQCINCLFSLILVDNYFVKTFRTKNPYEINFQTSFSISKFHFEYLFFF